VVAHLVRKSIINSVNLEDGEERFEKVVPLAREFGAALIVGCIDDDPVQGMAIQRDRKVDVARRSFGLLTGKYGVQAEEPLRSSRMSRVKLWTLASKLSR
jgi:5-methyltetrahydrofolate--homocysteine methyltransferase